MPAIRSSKKKPAAAKAAAVEPAAVEPNVEPKKDFAAVFAALRKLLSPYARDLRAQTDKPGYYCLESRTPTYRNRPMYFAGVRLGKNYVSYYLMSVYASPDFIRAMSPELKRRMQGKACFNFTTVDEPLFKELGGLTKSGYDKFKSLKYL